MKQVTVMVVLGSLALGWLVVQPTAARADDATASIDASASIAKAAPAPKKPISDGGIYLGLGGGLSPDVQAGAVMGSLVLDRPLFWRMGFWFSGEWNVLLKQPEPDLALRLCFGLRADLLRTESKSVRLISTLSFAHQHEAPVSGWQAHPFANLFGESKDGLGHRSGIEAGIGAIFTPWIAHQGFERRLRILARVSGEWLPDDKGPNFYLAFLTSVGLAI